MKKILLLEDDTWLAASYQRVLERHDYTVLVVTDAYRAIDIIENDTVGIIIADVVLESHTVFALLHELQSYDDTATIPIVLCTNVTVAHHIAKKLQAYGVKRLLYKATLTPEQLVEIVEEFTT